MRKITNVLMAVLALAGISAASAAEDAIGSVMRCGGQCVRAGAGMAKSLAGGDILRLMDRLSTGSGSRLAIALDDGTRLTLGEKADIVLDDFVYDANGAARFHAAVTGPFRYVSGKLAAGAMRQASVTTPFAVIGVRGTDFWGGPIGGLNAVVLFSGSVTVATPAGSVILAAPGEGTDISAPGAPPGRVSQWSGDRIATAVATVAFH